MRPAMMAIVAPVTSAIRKLVALIRQLPATATISTHVLMISAALRRDVLSLPSRAMTLMHAPVTSVTHKQAVFSLLLIRVTTSMLVPLISAALRRDVLSLPSRAMMEILVRLISAVWK